MAKAQGTNGSFTLEEDWVTTAAVFIYVIQFDEHPADHVDRAIAEVLKPGGVEISREQMIESLRYARETDQSVASIIPCRHSETVLRDYLSRVEQRLSESL